MHNPPRRCEMIRGWSPVHSNGMQVAVSVPLVLWLVGFVPTWAWAVNTGDIIVADRGQSLIFVDHVTGAQHLLSGTPPSGGGYLDVTTNAIGDVFALGTFPVASVYKIDTVNGARKIVAT